MPFGWRWPLRQRQAPVGRQTELTPVAPPRSRPAPFEPDAGMMAGLSERAEQRDALPLLGPQGGLPATARFLTVAREMADALPAAGWSQEVVDAAQSPVSGGGPDFISTLSSLASFRDRAAIAAGEAQGSPFPDWGPAGASTGVFAGAGGAAPGAEGSRPALGAGVSRSSIVARLAERRASESLGQARRGTPSSVAVSTGSASTAPPLAEPPRRSAAPVRRGLVTEQRFDSPATPAASESPAGQPRVQSVSEFPALDVATPVTPSATPSDLTPATPLVVDDAPPPPAGHAQEPASQVARLAAEPAAGAERRPTGEVPLPDARATLPPAETRPDSSVKPAAREASSTNPPNMSETVSRLVTSEAMPLLTAATHPEPRGEPIAGDAPGTDSPSMAATASRLVTSEEMPLLTGETRPEAPGEPVVGEAPGTDGPSVAATVSRLVAPAEMPLVTAETRVKPDAVEVVGTDAADPAVRVSSVLTPAEMGIQSVTTERPRASQRSFASEDVMTSTSAPRESQPTLPLVSGPGSVRGTQVELASGASYRTTGSPGDQVLARPQPTTTLHRFTDEETSGRGEQPEPGQPEPVRSASLAVSDAGAFASRVVGGLNEPLLLTEPRAAGVPAENGEQLGDVGGFSFASAGTGEDSPGSAPLQPTHSMPVSAVSRSTALPAETSRAMPVPLSRASGWEPRGAGARAHENTTAAGSSFTPGTGASRPVSRLAGLDQAKTNPLAIGRTSTADDRSEVPMRSTGSASPGWPGGFAPPSMDLAAPAVTWPEPGASPALARPSAPTNTTFPVSRLADLPLASLPGALRETEAAPAATDTAAPSTGAVGTAGPASPPAAAAAEGDVDKLADRVWQVIRRRLEVERERQRGLP